MMTFNSLQLNTTRSLTDKDVQLLLEAPPSLRRLKATLGFKHGEGSTLEYERDARGVLLGVFIHGQHRVRLTAHHTAVLLVLARKSPALLTGQEVVDAVRSEFRIHFESPKSVYDILDAFRKRKGVPDGVLVKGRSGPPGGVGFAVRVEPWAV